MVGVEGMSVEGAVGYSRNRPGDERKKMSGNERDVRRGRGAVGCGRKACSGVVVGDAKVAYFDSVEETLAP